MFYMTFGNVRSCGSSQDGPQRPGDNLFGDSIVARRRADRRVQVALPVDPPRRLGHGQRAPADARRHRGRRRSSARSSSTAASRATSSCSTAPTASRCSVVEKPMITDSRQNHAATQPFPETRLLPECVVWEKLDPENIPGDPWRARAELQRLPARRGWQPGLQPRQLRRGRRAVPDVSGRYPSDHRQGCMYDPHWDLPVLSTTSQNGGADWTNHSYSHSTSLVYFPYGVNPVAHCARRGGQRPARARAVPDRRPPRARRLQRRGRVENHFGLDCRTARDR